MLTADTITDAQIRDLLELDKINLVQFHQATDDIVGWADVDYQNARSEARARCAEILNARKQPACLTCYGRQEVVDTFGSVMAGVTTMTACPTCKKSKSVGAPSGLIATEDRTAVDRARVEGGVVKDHAQVSPVNGGAMTLDEAHYELRIFTLQSDSQAARAACLVLEEAKRLRQLLRDLVDFDMGELPEPDALCAVEGPRKFERYGRAWSAAITEVGPRNQRRFEGDEP